MKDVHKRRAFVLTGVLAVIVCAGVIAGQGISQNKALETSAEYVNYEKGEIQAHDGEVLVDSINISMKEGAGEKIKSQEGDAASGAAGDPANDAGAGGQTGIVGEAGVVTSDDLTDRSNTDSYYDEVRASINLDRDEILTMLTAVIEESDDGSGKENAQQQKLKIIEYMNLESVIEDLIENKGFSNVLALITDSSVTVTVDKQDLNQADVAQITDIVMRETGRPAEQIIIQSKF